MSSAAKHSLARKPSSLLEPVSSPVHGRAALLSYTSSSELGGGNAFFTQVDDLDTLSSDDDDDEAEGDVGAPDSLRRMGPWRLERSLGHGSSGQVRLARHVTSPDVLAAIKTISRSPQNADQAVSSTEREIALMKCVDHPHVLRLLDVYESPSAWHLVLEYCPQGELFRYLDREKGQVGKAEARKYLSQLTSAVAHLHSLDIAHRDVKLENCLLVEDPEFDPINSRERGRFNLKLSDCGLATFQSPETFSSTSCGSPHYAAPEVVAGVKYDAKAADVWSLGVVMFALVVRKLPFDESNVPEMLAKVKAGDFCVPEWVQGSARDVIERHTMVVDWQKRSKAADILKHPFLRDERRHLPATDVETSILFPSTMPTTPQELDFEVIESLKPVLRSESADAVALSVLLEPSASRFYTSLRSFKTSTATLSPQPSLSSFNRPPLTSPASTHDVFVAALNEDAPARGRGETKGQMSYKRRSRSLPLRPFPGTEGNAPTVERKHRIEMWRESLHEACDSTPSTLLPVSLLSPVPTSPPAPRQDSPAAAILQSPIGLDVIIERRSFLSPVENRPQADSKIPLRSKKSSFASALPRLRSLFSPTPAPSSPSRSAASRSAQPVTPLSPVFPHSAPAHRSSHNLKRRSTSAYVSFKRAIGLSQDDHDSDSDSMVSFDACRMAKPRSSDAMSVLDNRNSQSTRPSQEARRRSSAGDLLKTPRRSANADSDKENRVSHSSTSRPLKGKTSTRSVRPAPLRIVAVQQIDPSLRAFNSPVPSFAPSDRLTPEPCASMRYPSRFGRGFSDPATSSSSSRPMEAGPRLLSTPPRAPLSFAPQVSRFSDVTPSPLGPTPSRKSKNSHRPRDLSTSSESDYHTTASSISHSHHGHSSDPFDPFPLSVTPALARHHPTVPLRTRTSQLLPTRPPPSPSSFLTPRAPPLRSVTSLPELRVAIANLKSENALLRLADRGLDELQRENELLKAALASKDQELVKLRQSSLLEAQDVEPPRDLGRGVALQIEELELLLAADV